ncbi:BTB/POZ domain-containing protein 18-like [Oncorhynchus kisutch]|uniref:BTB/POZ domain-containing protein 18-like n=1 Tax=Oncorhynchus kisutch TaxID=8019 RepID=UPI0012DEBC77|nr:BTB/POZ domain-containing protein 18-like [Oncorhynchus kisutch]
MWRYQRPGFKALLLAELQRQRRCRQFCDKVLRAEGVSVPAHSYILSALSPQLSCALSTAPAPPSGQSQLLDFQVFGACTLVRLVGLLYSGRWWERGRRRGRK